MEENKKKRGRAEDMYYKDAIAEVCKETRRRMARCIFYCAILILLCAGHVCQSADLSRANERIESLTQENETLTDENKELHQQVEELQKKK